MRAWHVRDTPLALCRSPRVFLLFFQAKPRVRPPRGPCISCSVENLWSVLKCPANARSCGFVPVRTERRARSDPVSLQPRRSPSQARGTSKLGERRCNCQIRGAEPNRPYQGLSHFGASLCHHAAGTSVTVLGIGIRHSRIHYEKQAAFSVLGTLPHLRHGQQPTARHGQATNVGMFFPIDWLRHLGRVLWIARATDNS